MKTKIDILFELLKEGQGLTINSIRIGVNEGQVFVTGWTGHTSIKDIDKNTALHKLEEIKAKFREIIRQKPELVKFFQMRKVKFYLAFNYGMGSTSVCYELDGVIHWEI